MGPAKREFVDLYEVLEVSSNASFETIERVFRHLAARYHPDVAESGDRNRFTELVNAFDVLGNPQSRAAHDAALDRYRKQQAELLANASRTSEDFAERHKLLSLFYGQRRRDFKQPGLGISTIESAMKIPLELLEFHLWYFREKNWIKREESGLLSITCEGVDEIEARELARQSPMQAAQPAQSGPLIEVRDNPASRAIARSTVS